jgi:protoporphyrinogen oxidase
MPVQNLVQSMIPEAPVSVQEVANGLMYRDFIIIGMLLKKLKITNETKIPTIKAILPDNWIYIQEKAVKLGRVTIFNNWSPYLVKDPDTVWLGLEYFCSEGDVLWNKPDAEFIGFAIDEIAQIEIIDKEDVLDATVIRMKKTYPAYFGAYENFQVIRDFTDEIENLFLVGRNGMHRYNNTDHSMLTAMLAVENIIKGNPSKDNIWQVNTEDDYHEQV